MQNMEKKLLIRNEREKKHIDDLESKLKEL